MDNDNNEEPAFRRKQPQQSISNSQGIPLQSTSQLPGEKPIDQLEVVKSMMRNQAPSIPAPLGPDNDSPRQPMSIASGLATQRALNTNLERDNIPSTVILRLRLVYAFCYLNVLFLLVYFPVTVFLRNIIEPYYIFTHRFGFVSYLVMEAYNLLITMLIYRMTKDLTRLLLKVALVILLISALANLIIGVIVFALSTPTTKVVFEQLTDTQKAYFIPVGSSSATADDYKAYYTNNMILIGIYCLVEMIIFLLLAFLEFFLLNALASDHYNPQLGPKPFEQHNFLVKRSKVTAEANVIDLGALEDVVEVDE